MLGRLLYSPFLAQLVVIRRCNLSCTYCNEFDDHSPPVETAELKERLAKLRDLGTWAVDFTGGEPLLHPDIFELIRHAKKDLKFHKVMLLSNGYKFSREVVEKLNDAGLDALQISVDGVEPNDVTVKVLKPLRKKLMYIAEHATFETTLSGVIGSAPAGEATEVVKFARENGFTPRVLLIHDGDGQLKLTPEQLDEYREVAELIGQSFKESRGYRDRLIETGEAPFKCRAGSRYLYVDEFGAVHWCSQMRGEWSIDLADYTRADLKQQFYTRKPCNAHCTVGCARTSSSPDEWRRQHLTPDLSGGPGVVPADRLTAK
jgi:MoaA/NifB/PqqE/SkfB family radical SAM enzyme